MFTITKAGYCYEETSTSPDMVRFKRVCILLLVNQVERDREYEQTLPLTNQNLQSLYIKDKVASHTVPTITSISHSGGDDSQYIQQTVTEQRFPIFLVIQQ